MPIRLTPDGDLSSSRGSRGTLAKVDLDRVQTKLVDEMRPGAPVRVLFILDQFDGWSRMMTGTT